MPYVGKEDRKEIDLPLPSTAGRLNYWLTMFVKKYLDFNGESYQTYNDLVGALELCKLELFRRKIAYYEDKKIQENGDVY